MHSIFANLQYQIIHCLKELSLMAFLSTCARHHFDLSDLEIAFFISVVFLGEFAGSIMFGSVADKYGRKRTFIFGRSD